MAGELDAVLNEMKGKGIGGAVVRVDGVTAASTIALNELSSSLLASVANVSDAIMKKMEDQQKEVEISFGSSTIYIVPVKNYIFCGMIKSSEDKKVVNEYAMKAKAYL